MTRPTKFDVMRRNRRVLEQAASARQVEAEWEQRFIGLEVERQERGQDTVDWLAETREEASARRHQLSDTTVLPGRRRPAGWVARVLGAISLGWRCS